ncbi:hypothetical protein H6F51_02315 [Cyanobacteria bacterium FACHB-DQ100]|nr:hypothetical protein [Cyanobacteria bacterium FACHB-DQ100]
MDKLQDLFTSLGFYPFANPFIVRITVSKLRPPTLLTSHRQGMMSVNSIVTLDLPYLDLLLGT